MDNFDSIKATGDALRNAGYIADEKISSILYLATRMHKPILLEGPAGVGKTQLAKSVSKALSINLIRLQCYEGLDESKAIYEWNYKKQLLRIQADKDSGDVWEDIKDDIFSESYLLERPLLQAISSDSRSVLLVDEVDRIEEETEALLLEVLSEYQVSVPEFGTIKAKSVPIVLLTSNNTRELSEALKRRCLYLPMEYPDLQRESEIIRINVPNIDEDLALQVAEMVSSIRNLDLKKDPSVSEAIDWAESLVILGIKKIDSSNLEDGLSILLKYKEDIDLVRKEMLNT